MNELLLQYLWNHKVFGTHLFQDTEGNPVKVLDFGSWNRDAGADFQVARIETNGIRFSGHIELHLRSSDWDLHGHSKDEAYQNVILHAVFIHNKEIAFLKERNIPTIELKNYISPEVIARYEALASKAEFIPCQELFLGQKQSEDFHRENLLKKLDEKSEKIQRELERYKNDYEAVLFHYMAYSFGLKVNAEIFKSIAESAPFSTIRKLSQEAKQLESFLFGKAGWLTHPTDEEHQSWKREYDFITKKFNLGSICFSPKFLRLRPANFPTIRLSQLAQVYHLNQNLFSKIMEAKTYAQLKNLFSGVKASSYWDTHFKFGKEVAKSHSKKLSAAFIDLIIINVILPMKYAYYSAFDEKRGEMKEEIIGLYKEIPAEKNTIISEWKVLGCEVKNALQSQSYLYQYRSFCLRKKCLNCAVGLQILRKSEPN